MTLVDTYDNDGPLCPMSMGFDVSPQAQFHLLKNQIADEFYGQFETDDEGTIKDEAAQKAYNHVMYDSRFSDRMQLYKGSARPKNSRNTYVESHWFQCLVCGFVLPTTLKVRTP